jgi:hypothetical protein
VKPAQDIADFAREHLRAILPLSGYVLYSAAETISRGSVYLLGHNPGGSPDDQVEATIEASLDALPNKELNNYLDETWTMSSGRTFLARGAPLQRRVNWLLTSLGLSTRSVPASNLVFARSIDAARSRFVEPAELCWPVHERIIEYVDPRVLVVFGNSKRSPYSFIRAKCGSRTMEDEFDSGHSPWRCRTFETMDGRTVIGLPRLSRYNEIGRGGVIDWIRTHAAL